MYDRASLYHAALILTKARDAIDGNAFVDNKLTLDKVRERPYNY